MVASRVSICGHCGREFIRSPRQKGRKQVFCSYECQRGLYTQLAPAYQVCDWCGCTFQLTQRGGRVPYYCTSCRMAAHQANTRAGTDIVQGKPWGLTIREIAQRLGMQEQEVRTTLRRALNKLSGSKTLRSLLWEYTQRRDRRSYWSMMGDM